MGQWGCRGAAQAVGKAVCAHTKKGVQVFAQKGFMRAKARHLAGPIMDVPPKGAKRGAVAAYPAGQDLVVRLATCHP